MPYRYCCASRALTPSSVVAAAAAAAAAAADADADADT